MSNLSIYLITKDKETRYWYPMNQGAKDMAELLGVNYQWEAPLKRNVEEQIQIFKKVAESDADAILLAASDPLAIAPAVEDAKAKGIKIIYVDSPAYEEAVITIATQNYIAGRIAGDNMLKKLEAVGIKDGSIGIIGVSPENETTKNREKGFTEVIKADGKYKLLNTKYTESNPSASQKAAKSFIDENPDLAGLFGTSEDSTLGIGKEIGFSGKKIIGVGFDITDEIQKMIKQNTLQVVLVQNPYTMGYFGMAEAMAALKGYQTGPPFIDTGVTIIDRYTPVRAS